MTKMPSRADTRSAAAIFAFIALTGALFGDRHPPAHSVEGMRGVFSKRELPEELGEIPRFDGPLYAREAHIWFFSPHGSEGIAQPGYRWTNQGKPGSRVIGPAWLRDNETPGQPLIGLYNSGEPEVMRWQLRNARNAGLDAITIPLHPEPRAGEIFHGEGIFATMLDVAAEESFKVGMSDEVMFARGWEAQKPEVFARRAGEFLGRHGGHPGYLKIDGKPAYEFQFYDRWQHSEAWKDLNPAGQARQLDEMLAKAERIAGRSVYWILHMGPDRDIMALERIRAVVPVSNSNQIVNVGGYREIPFELGGVQDRLNAAKPLRDLRRDLKIGGAIYPGFDNSNLFTVRHPHGLENRAGWIPRHGGKTLVELLRAYQREGMDFAFFTSWNDWLEATNIEPGFDFHGYNGDPYLYLRIIAAARGKSFTPAPLPPKEVVDPMFWEPLYGIDRTPPRFFDTRYVPLDPAVVSSVADSASAVTRAWSVYDGDREWDGRRPERTRGLRVSGGESVDNGIRLNPGQSLRIQVDPWRDPDSHDLPVFLVLEMEGIGFAMLTVRHPTDPPHNLFALERERTYPVIQRHEMLGDREHPFAVFHLNAWDDRNRNPVIGAEFVAKRGALPEGLEDPSVTVTRVLMFRELADSREAIEVGFAHPESQVKTFRFQTPPLQGETPSAVYLFAEDAEGNRTGPRPVHGSQHRPVGVFPGGDGY